LRVRATAELRERALAEAWEAGALGFEEVGVVGPSDDAVQGVGGGPEELVIYAPAARMPEIEALLKRTLLGSSAHVGTSELVTPTDWSENSRRQQRPVDISPRLRVRPPFAEPGDPARREVVIEPRQAFGTGSHASTALAARWIDRELVDRPLGRVLDVGCGSGVLAIAAHKLGAREVFACDVDPIAARETRENAWHNAASIAVWCGSLAALHSATRFDLVVANMIRSELEPLLPLLLRATDRAGRLVVSGLLADEERRFGVALGAHGALAVGRLEERDQRGDHWIALRIAPAGA